MSATQPDTNQTRAANGRAEHDEAAKRSYTRWGQPYEAALARGHDHGSAAYIADQWEAKHIHLTGGTGIIRNAADAAKRR